MNRIDLKAVVLAFAAEFALDMLVVRILVMIFGGELFVPGMSEDEVQKVVETIAANGNSSSPPSSAACPRRSSAAISPRGSRRAFRYYNGLRNRRRRSRLRADLRRRQGRCWITILGVLLTIPASIYGAHIASKRAPTAEEMSDAALRRAVPRDQRRQGQAHRHGRSARAAGKLGYTDVQTLLNSGNAVFSGADETSPEHAARIREAVRRSSASTHCHRQVANRHRRRSSRAMSSARSPTIRRACWSP